MLSKPHFVVFFVAVFTLCRAVPFRVQNWLLLISRISGRGTMNVRAWYLWLLSTIFLLAACSPESKDAGEGMPKRRLPVLQEVKVEVRADGLAYLPGADKAFTGDAVSLHYDRTPPRLFVRTPYVEGRKHGVKVTYTSGGKLREERTYREGWPLSSVVYHGNGQKKIEVLLNGRDLAEGPYRRWHDNGVLQAESSFDADERFHGEEKDYDREGKLIGHYRNDHGRLIEVIFETAEMKAERLSKMVPAAPGGGSVPPLPPKP